MVVKVPQPKPLHLQPCLQDPGIGGWESQSPGSGAVTQGCPDTAGAWGWGGVLGVGQTGGVLEEDEMSQSPVQKFPVLASPPVTELLSVHASYSVEV